MFPPEALKQLKEFLEIVKKQPLLLYTPDLLFFREFIESFGGALPPPPQSAPSAESDSDKPKEPETKKPATEPEESDDEVELVESDVELDNTGVIESPDEVENGELNVPNTEVEVSEENIEKANEKKMEGLSQYSEGNYEKAAQLFTEAIELNPGMSLLYVKRGQCNLQLSKPNACIRDCTTALAINPDNAAAYKFRGRAQRLLGHWLEAVKDLRSACKIDYDEQADEWLKEVTPNIQLISATIQSAAIAYEMVLGDEACSNEESDSEEDSSGDDYVDELLELCKRRRVAPLRRKLFLETTMSRYSDKEFQTHYRISRAAFENLLRMSSALLERQRIIGRQRLDPRKQLLAVLWLLATSDSYQSVGYRFDMSKSSLSTAFMRVIQVLNMIGSDVIRWPNAFERRTIEKEFRKMNGSVEGVIGAIDRTYVPIKAPRINPEKYVYRENTYGITLQAVCDHNMRFLDCCCGYPSSVPDFCVFKSSDIFKKLQGGDGDYVEDKQFIVGSHAYPCTRWCIPPYSSAEVANGPVYRKRFNERHAKLYRTIERCFALLFGRFRRLRFLDMNRIDLIPSAIVAMCSIHNVCLMGEDEFAAEYEKEGEHFLRGNVKTIFDETEHIEVIMREDIEGHTLKEEIAAALP